ncbi:ATP-binding protein [Alginatibacterium sediminis]|uniref:ATP-binding protein n=1 Tax=Alginatibacterium sediminis TaxID=2164068 RepID=A0A420ED95_9ALTE|nr:AAA family ATPase [Alginatibacterium sediminis]RKF18645.1 ATP-binding protein [Alginatibacterium sediminis]
MSVKVYAICGFIGSGKTTLANQIAEHQRAYRFSIDEWMIPLFGEHMPREQFDSRLACLSTLFDNAALDLLKLGVSVIFDYGFWAFRDRERLRSWAKQHQLDLEIVYLDVSFERCCQQAKARNQLNSDLSYQMSDEMLAMFWHQFEVPKSTEHLVSVISSKE